MDAASSEGSGGKAPTLAVVMQIKMLIREAGLAAIHRFGMKVYDSKSGQFLGRALLVPWKGKIHVLGLFSTVRPVFLPQPRLTFWKQTLGFHTLPRPDFPSLHGSSEHLMEESDKGKAGSAVGFTSK